MASAMPSYSGNFEHQVLRRLVQAVYVSIQTEDAAIVGPNPLKHAIAVEEPMIIDEILASSLGTNAP